MFEECKLDILGLSEIKLRGEGEMSFRGLYELCRGWREEEIRERKYRY